jgi:glutaminyl-peptide cyclotransferase|tara:strand:+ start:653 stop:1657 length:1005 start_codon:yes stop_codon:yes gene_type:complete
MRKPDGQTLFLGSAILGGAVLVLYLAFFHGNGQAGNPRQPEADLATIPFNGQRSYQVLKDICAIGRRVSGSQGMAAQQKLLGDHFRAIGGDVRLQTFRVRHPEDGSPVEMANMIVQWYPQRLQRILLCAHYDTRPFPDRDRQRPRGLFLGANDGASGAALLAEMAHHMPLLESNYGVDFVLFDGEEFVFDDKRDSYFLGSEFFARDYVANPPSYRYQWGVLVDMIGDAELQLYHEVNSVNWPDVRELVFDIWKTADRLGVKEFIPRKRHTVRDDHLALRNIAGIPSCDIIDFDYPRPGARRSYWHTEQDVPENCSAASLAKVGWVLVEWLQNVD